MILKIIIVTIILISSVQISYARYIQTEMVKGSQEILVPILTIQEGNIVKINKENNIDYYEFSIKNFNQDKISETGFLYTLEIISNVSEAVQFELYSGEEQISLNNLKTEKILIRGNEKIEQKYKLKITYNNIQDDKEIFGKVQIKVHSEQEKI